VLAVSGRTLGRDRAPGEARGSDAGPDVIARLGATFSCWDELPREAILTLRSGIDPELLVDLVADWLDARASVTSAPASLPAAESTI
jgi:hypothetical protein